MAILIANGRIVTAAEDFQADILVEGETILAIGENLAQLPGMEHAQIIDAAGKLVLPGGIDPHVHLDMPFMSLDLMHHFRTEWLNEDTELSPLLSKVY